MATPKMASSTNSITVSDESDCKGYVYILTNPSMPGLVKIGFTNQYKLDYRLTDLWMTGVPEPFTLEASYKTRDALNVEKTIHKLLDKYRYNPLREFFKISIEDLFKILNTEMPDIVWATEQSYILNKKSKNTEWLVEYTKNLNTLLKEVTDFEIYAKTKDWFESNFEDGLINKQKIERIKERLQILVEGLSRREYAIKDELYRSKFLKIDNKYAKKELNDLRKSFDNTWKCKWNIS